MHNLISVITEKRNTLGDDFQIKSNPESKNFPENKQGKSLTDLQRKSKERWEEIHLTDSFRYVQYKIIDINIELTP